MSMDIIGIVIAFSVVMLLLSLMVTTLGQATQAALRLRGRNLKAGSSAILAKNLQASAQSTHLAEKVLNDVPEILEHHDFKLQSIRTPS